jgi:hypothetical protein
MHILGPHPAKRNINYPAFFRHQIFEVPAGPSLSDHARPRFSVSYVCEHLFNNKLSRSSRLRGFLEVAEMI